MNGKKIKIALVAPSFGDTGGPEVATQNLANALFDLGADVTLFAPADWKTKVKHIPTLKKSLWNMKDFTKQDEFTRRNYLLASQTKILSYQNDFDIIHLNSQSYAYAVAANLKKPCVLSFHNRIASWQYDQLKKTEAYLVSLTKTQKEKFKISNVIYCGLPLKKIRPSFGKGQYLITIGRLTDQKGIDLAIKIAKRAGKKLLIFGRIGTSEERQKYYKEKIAPYLDGKQIIYMKEVSHEKIYNYLRDAEALLFTIKRPEAFGLVSIEALACGTPVIGTAVSPLPELLKDKRISFLSNDIGQLIKYAKNTDLFDRKECRKYAEKNFDSSVMAKKYLKLYEKILQNNK